MSQLTNITTKELFKLKPDRFNSYNAVLKDLIPKPVLNKTEATPLNNLKFGEVLTIRHYITEPTVENIAKIFEIVFGLPLKKFFRIKVVEFYAALNWIKEQINILEVRENKELVSKLGIDPNLKEAGVDELKEIGLMNVFIRLGKAFSQPPHQIQEWKYSMVFSILKEDRISSDVNRRYNEIIKRKNK